MTPAVTPPATLSDSPVLPQPRGLRLACTWAAEVLCGNSSLRRAPDVWARSEDETLHEKYMYVFYILLTDMKTIFPWNMCSYFLRDSKRGLRVLCSCWSISTSCSSFTRRSSGTTGGAACALTPATCAITPHPPAGLHGAPEKGAAWRSCARGRGWGDVQHKQPG